eukprot:3229189-Alexandrium_andersonii.AAC.1
MDGMPWKKATKFLGIFLDLDPVERRCTGRLCQRTGRPHQVLPGRSPQGPLWTKVAEPYPAPLARRLAKAFETAVMTVQCRCVEQ